MHRNRFVFGVSAMFLAAGIVVTAQQGHGAGPKTTHTTTTPKANAAKPTVAKPATPKAAPTPHATSAKPQAAAQSKVKTQPKPATIASGGKSQTKAGKPETAASKAPAKSPTSTAAKTDKTTTKTAKNDSKTVKSAKVTDTKLAKTEKKSDKPAKTATQTTATKSGPTSTPTTTTQLTPVQQKLKQNTNLAAKLESRLPKGTNLMTAAEGFRNLGQFVAAVNVSNNLGISFDELKTKMVTNNMSLGQAIQATRPLTASPTIEAQRAEYDARGMIAESEQTEASAAPRAHGPVTTPTSSATPTPTAASSTVKTKAKTTKTPAQ